MLQKKMIGQRQYLPLRVACEVVLAIALLILVGWFLPPTWAPAQCLFCLAFVMIFAFTIRYPTYLAYASALLTTSGYGFLLWFHPTVQIQPAISLFLMPVLLFLTGIICSDLFRSQKLRLDKLDQAYSLCQEREQTGSRRYQALLEINGELERRVNGQPISLMTFCGQLAYLWQLKGQARQQAILDMVLHTIEAQTGALYLFEHDVLQLAATQQPVEQGQLLQKHISLLLEKSYPLVSNALQQRRVCTIHDLLREEKSTNETSGIMAGPLYSQNGHLLGVLLIHTMPLFKFSPATIKLFQELLPIAAIALSTEEAQNDNNTCNILLPEPTTQGTSLTPMPESLHVELAQSLLRSIQ